MTKTNTAAAAQSLVTVTLLKEDFECFVASIEDLLHNDAGFRDLHGEELAAAIEALTPQDYAKDADDAADHRDYDRKNAARLRRLIAARGN